MWAIRGCCNPSLSTDPEETKIVYIVLEEHTSKPVYAYYSCTVGQVINDVLQLKPYLYPIQDSKAYSDQSFHVCPGLNTSID